MRLLIQLGNPPELTARKVDCCVHYFGYLKKETLIYKENKKYRFDVSCSWIYTVELQDIYCGTVVLPDPTVKLHAVKNVTLGLEDEHKLDFNQVAQVLLVMYTWCMEHGLSIYAVSQGCLVVHTELHAPLVMKLCLVCRHIYGLELDGRPPRKTGC